MLSRRFGSALLLVALAFTFGALSASAQGGTATLRGRVIQSDGVPVGGATITALENSSESSREYARTTTAADGSWSMEVPAGTTIWPHFNTFGPWWGYSYNPPFNLAAGAVAENVDFVLAPRAVAEQTAPPPAQPEPTAVPTPVPAPAPGMPTTGAAENLLGVLFAAALALVLGGLWLQRRVSATR